MSSRERKHEEKRFEPNEIIPPEYHPNVHPIAFDEEVLPTVRRKEALRAKLNNPEIHMTTLKNYANKLNLTNYSQNRKAELINRIVEKVEEQKDRLYSNWMKRISEGQTIWLSTELEKRLANASKNENKYEPEINYHHNAKFQRTDGHTAQI